MSNKAFASFVPFPMYTLFFVSSSFGFPSTLHSIRSEWTKQPAELNRPTVRPRVGSMGRREDHKKIMLMLALSLLSLNIFFVFYILFAFRKAHSQIHINLHGWGRWYPYSYYCLFLFKFYFISFHHYTYFILSNYWNIYFWLF